MQVKEEMVTVTVATRITKPMHNAVQTILSSNAHQNVADYIRDLIRRDLEERGLLTEKESDQR